MSKPNIGVMFRREYAPESLPEFAAQTEAIGFDELWVVEDCFYMGGFAQAGVALASTEHIKISLGIAPAVARNAAFTAMEIATLARIYPGRFLPGLGHGVRGWMQQIGALPTSQLRALEEHTVAVRSILRGENVTQSGLYVDIFDVQLTHPLSEIPPVSLGVRGPKSLHISGRVADGTIMAEGSSVAYIRGARKQIEQGRQEARRSDSHRLTLYLLWSMDENVTHSKEIARPSVAHFLMEVNAVYSDALGITAEVQALLDKGGHAYLAHNMPEAWLHHLAALGSIDECAATVQAFAETGVDSIVLVPQHDLTVTFSDRTTELLKALS